jgi:Cu(I)/Ag(I) efflux system periplasmic protein CusF
MKQMTLAAAAAALVLSGTATLAQGTPMVSGTVEKIDTAQGKLTIDHGAIPNLQMDPMTMVFRAGDPAMLKSVKAGDKVQFQADRVNGQITITKIQKAK